MTDAAVPGGQTQAVPQGRAARARRWFQRAATADGHERHTLSLIGKSTVVASISWFIAHDVMQAQTPAFAPFSAVLIMQITVYQSLLQTLRYVGAVVVGVALQGALGLLAGSGLLTFVMVAMVALVIGRWRPLGPQGSQVTTAAFFAFSTYAAATSTREGLSQLGQITVLVLIGCGVGVVVNVLVLPPMRYRSAEYGIRALGGSLRDLVGDIYPALREGKLEKERTEHWRHRAAQLAPIVVQAQASVRTAWESTFYNPRHMLQRRRHPSSFTSYQTVINALERVTYQLASMTRSLDQSSYGDGDPQHSGFLRRYADFLACFTRVADLLSRIDEDHLHEQTLELYSAAQEAQEHRNLLAEDAENSSLPLSDPSQPYGILLAEAVRLMDEIQHTYEALQQAVDHTPSTHRP